MFGDMKTAEKAVKNTNGFILGGRNLVVKVTTFGWSQRLTVKNKRASVHLEPYKISVRAVTTQAHPA